MIQSVSILDKIKERQQHRDTVLLPYWRNAVDSLQLGEGNNSLSVKWSQFIPPDILPSSKQLAFLLLDSYREVFYGGAARSGKSIAVLMAALQWADDPDYAGILFRKTLTAASRPGGVLDVMMKWAQAINQLGADYGVSFDPKINQFRFHPYGSTLTFGFLEAWNDFENYQGNQYAFIGCDELDQFDEITYNKLFTRLSNRCRTYKRTYSQVILLQLEAPVAALDAGRSRFSPKG